MTKVYVHPSVDIYYSGFYLFGLEQVFGKENIIYSAKPFDFAPPHASRDIRGVFAFYYR